MPRWAMLSVMSSRSRDCRPTGSRPEENGHPARRLPDGALHRAGCGRCCSRHVRLPTVCSTLAALASKRRVAGDVAVLISPQNVAARATWDSHPDVLPLRNCSSGCTQHWRRSDERSQALQPLEGVRTTTRMGSNDPRAFSRARPGETGPGAGRASSKAGLT